MLVGIESSDLARLSREMRAVDRNFANAMQKELRDAVAPFTATLKQSARVNTPSFLSAADVASTVRQSVGYKGVAVKRESNSRFSQAGALDAGMVRHPLFGNRDYWYDTRTPESAGWWSEVADDNVDETTDRLAAALLKIVDRLASGNLSTTRVGRSTVLT